MGAAGTANPSGRAGLVGPKPVPYTVSSSPIWASEVCVTSVPSAWKASAKDWLFTICWNNPGASCTTVKFAATLAAPAATTVRVTAPGCTSAGSWKFIYEGETKNSGNKRLPSISETPPSVCGSGFPGAVAVPAAIFPPKIDATDPGAMAFTGVVPAPFSIPVGATYGILVMVASTARGALMVTEPEEFEPVRSPLKYWNLKPVCGSTLTVTAAPEL